MTCHRFRSESKSFLQSPSTVPEPRLFTSTLCTVLKTGESSTNNLTQSTVLSQGSSDLKPPPEYNLVQGSNLPDGFNDVPQRRNASLTTVQDLSQNLHAQSFGGLDPDLHSWSTSAGDTGSHGPSNSSQSTTDISKTVSSTKLLCGSENKIQQDTKSIKCPKDTTSQMDRLTKTNTSLITQQNSDFRSLFLFNNLVETKASTSSLRGTNPQSDPVSKAEDSTHLQDTDSLASSETTIKDSANPQDMNLLQLSTCSRSGPGWAATPFQTKSRDGSLMTTSGVTQQTVFSQSPPSDRFCSNQAIKGQREGHMDSLSQSKVPKQTTSVNNFGICSSRRSLHTVRPLHEFLASSSALQSVHGPSIGSRSQVQLTDPPQTRALTHPANLHATPTPSPFHLLTSPKDPDVCQPMVVREEIRLTPQIQGPPVSAPPSQVQARTLPWGKGSRPGPPCFTRPLSRATVMEGFPVTLEVEVMGNPEPWLTWWVAYNRLHGNTQAS